MSTALIVVVGDSLLDVDLVGSASRLAPDSPVPVVDNVVEQLRPGGAALAATLLARDGHDVVLVTALGDDENSRRLSELLGPRVAVVASSMRGGVPRKTRVRAGAQSLVRFDSGGGELVADRAFERRVRSVFQGAGSVLVSDYGGGVTALLRDALGGIPGHAPLVWDPHPRGVPPIAGASAVTPNLDEAMTFARAQRNQVVPGGTGLTAVVADARELVSAWKAHSVCITMGAKGALLSFGDDSPLIVPAPAVYCVDPCGAGDRFAGAFAAALARGMLPSQAARSAVVAASQFVELGVSKYLGLVDAHSEASSVDAADVRRRVAAVRDAGGVVVATGGCFDLLHAGHVETLRAARSLGDFLVVCVNSDASISRLKGPDRPLIRAQDRVRVLEALECVDAVVVFDEDDPSAILRQLRPQVWAKGGDYGGRVLPESSVLADWGGQAVVLPYLDGRSTTALASALASRPFTASSSHQRSGA